MFHNLCFAQSIPLATQTHHIASGSCSVKQRARATPTLSSQRARMQAEPAATSGTQKSTAAAVAEESSSRKFSWSEQWYPVAWESDVKTGEIFTFQVFDRSYILVRDTTGDYSAMDDLCPHRAAPLSEGRLYDRKTPDGDQTVIECGYHGWRFGCDGACLDIPVSTADPSAAARVRGVYKTAVAPFRLIFVWLGDATKAPPLLLPTLLYPESNRTVTYFRDMQRKFPVPFQVIVENVVDPAHVAWAHHGTKDGNRGSVNREGNGIKVKQRDPDNGFFSAEVNTFNLHLSVRGHFSHYSGLPDSEGNPRFHFLIWTVPHARELSSIFAMRAMIDPPRLFRLYTAMPRWIQHADNNLVLDGDMPLLQHAHSELARTSLRTGRSGWRQHYLLSETKWDDMVFTYLNWFDSVSNTLPYRSPVPDRPPERIPPAEVINRYHWHTQYCTHCLGALRNFRIISQIARIIGFFAALATVTTALCAAAFASNQPGAACSLARYATMCAVVGLLMAITAIFSKKGIASLTFTEQAKKLRNRSSGEPGF